MRNKLGRRGLNAMRNCLKLDRLEEKLFLSTTPTIVNTFEGTNGGTYQSSLPDTMGAVGGNYIVDFLNGQFTIQSKTTGAIVASQSDGGFWSGLLNYNPNSVFDPRVIFDTNSGRWFATEIGNNRNSIFVAVSGTSDPTGAWKAFALTDSRSANQLDFDSLGADANGVYVTANIESADSGLCWAISKSNVLWVGAGNPVGSSQTAFSVAFGTTASLSEDSSTNERLATRTFDSSNGNTAIGVQTITWPGGVANLSAQSCRNTIEMSPFSPQ